MVLNKWIWVSCGLLSLSFVILLAIGQLQLYFLTSVDSVEDIKVGYPFYYYSFSRDGNNFHGGNLNNLILDYCLTVLTVAVAYISIKLIKGRLQKKYGDNNK